jgi:hypothetical protein
VFTGINDAQASAGNQEALKKELDALLLAIGDHPPQLRGQASGADRNSMSKSWKT